MIRGLILLFKSVVAYQRGINLNEHMHMRFVYLYVY